jgi:hypothetical protein
MMVTFCLVFQVVVNWNSRFSAWLKHHNIH